MFWGFLFFFDFRIQGFDILPDVIGYWLIYTGARDLILQSNHFNIVRKYALPLIIVSLFDIYQVQTPIEQFTINPLVFLFILVGFLITIIDLILIYNLCFGIVEMALANDDFQLSSTAEFRWEYYLYVKIAMLIFTSIGFIARHLIVIGFIPLFIISTGILVLMMGLMKRADQALILKACNRRRLRLNQLIDVKKNLFTVI